MTEFTPLTGGCLCSAVRYTITAPVRRVVNCHCTRCRKISGAAFSTVFLARQGDFRLDTGDEAVSAYPLSPQSTKYFCATCGSPVYNRIGRLPKHIFVALGSLDDPKAVTPEINIHCENMLGWVKGVGELPLYPRSAEEGLGGNSS